MDLTFNATLLAQIFHFVVLLVLLRLFAYKPLLNILEQRQKLVASSIEAAEAEKAQAEKIRAQYEADLRNAREEAKAIIERATKAANEQAQSIVDAAKTEAARVKESALQDIQREKDKALAELRNEVASLAVLVAAKVVKQGLDVDAQSKLVQDAINEVNNLPC